MTANTMTRQAIETALDQGKVEILMGTGKWWRARRNGRTQTWKTRPSHFRIPIKFGLRGYDAIDHDNMNGVYFRINEEQDVR